MLALGLAVGQKKAHELAAKICDIHRDVWKAIVVGTIEPVPDIFGCTEGPKGTLGMAQIMLPPDALCTNGLQRSLDLNADGRMSKLTVDLLRDPPHRKQWNEESLAVSRMLT